MFLMIAKLILIEMSYVQNLTEFKIFNTQKDYIFFCRKEHCLYVYLFV